MPKAVTILSLISSEGYYGAENMLVALAQSLSKLGCQCIVGVFRDSRNPHTEVAEQARKRGLTVEIVPCSGRADWSAVRGIRKLLRKYRVDILNPHGYKADLYAFAAAWPGRAALAATVHNWPSTLLSMRAYAALDKLMLGRFNKVIAVSDFAAEILRRWNVEPSKLSMIANGVELERFGNAKETLREKIGRNGCALVGFVGRLVPDKGGADLLHAAKQVIAMCPKTLFVFVGEGPARTEWEKLAVELGIREQVVFTGACDDMPGVYASLDMVVLPSFAESMPMCLLEAMAAGRPVVATTVGSVPKLILPEETGFLVEPGDVNGLASAILRLLENPELAAQMGNSGRARIVDHFSAEQMARSYLRQYEEVLSGRTHGNRKEPLLEVSAR
jgi:glycosyltransferase involved in cell wall biosynthesis